MIAEPVDSEPIWHLIRCVVVGGATRPFLSRLAREQGVWSFFYNGSRSAVADHSRTRARVVSFVENEEIFIVVEDDRLAAITAFCYRHLHLGEPGRGILYVTKLDRAAPMMVPEMENCAHPS